MRQCYIAVCKEIQLWGGRKIFSKGLFLDEVKKKVTIRKCVFPYLLSDRKSRPCSIHGFFFFLHTLEAALEQAFPKTMYVSVHKCGVNFLLYCKYRSFYSEFAIVLFIDQQKGTLGT